MRGWATRLGGGLLLAALSASWVQAAITLTNPFLFEDTRHNF
jgi:hypothetical protein